MWNLSKVTSSNLPRAAVEIIFIEAGDISQLHRIDDKHTAALEHHSAAISQFLEYAIEMDPGSSPVSLRAIAVRVEGLSSLTDEADVARPKVEFA